MQAAADWTSVLINMNKDSVEASLQKLHEGTVGQLNADFESTVEPYTQAGADAAGEDHRPDRLGGDRVDPPRRSPARTARRRPAAARAVGVASRTDTVMVVATSISENAGADKPQTVRWNLRLDVSDVDGKLLISRLEPIR